MVRTPASRSASEALWRCRASAVTLLARQEHSQGSGRAHR
jgi:hypothetical protein